LSGTKPTRRGAGPFFVEAQPAASSARGRRARGNRRRRRRRIGAMGLVAGGVVEGFGLGDVGGLFGGRAAEERGAEAFEDDGAQGLGRVAAGGGQEAEFARRRGAGDEAVVGADGHGDAELELANDGVVGDVGDFGERLEVGGGAGPRA